MCGTHGDLNPMDRGGVLAPGRHALRGASRVHDGRSGSAVVRGGRRGHPKSILARSSADLRRRVEQCGMVRPCLARLQGVRIFGVHRQVRQAGASRRVPRVVGPPVQTLARAPAGVGSFAGGRPLADDAVFQQSRDFVRHRRPTGRACSPVDSHGGRPRARTTRDARGSSVPRSAFWPCSRAFHTLHFSCICQSFWRSTSGSVARQRPDAC